MRDTIKRLPKLRGHGKNRARTVNSARVVYTPVNIAVLDASFKNNDTVSPKTLAERGIVATRSGRAPAVKILGKGEIKTAVTVEGCKISVAARTAIEKAGGTIR
jgi:large subunit ribosomal protein L15